MNSKIRLGAVAVGVAGVLALAACSTSPSSVSANGGNATLTFMTFETPDLTASFWDNSIKNAQKVVPGVTVKKIVTPNTDRNAYAKQLQASGQFPDILSSIDPKQFTQAGLLKPFDQSWLKANFADPTGNNIDGKTYIPPTNSQIIPLVFYNKKIFADNGITVPTTWDELMSDVRKLRANNVTPMEMAGGDATLGNIPLSGIITADVLGKDPNWVQEKYAGNVKFTDGDFVSAVQNYRDLIKAGAFDPNALGVSYDDANNQFLAGKAAMYPMGSWLLGQITPQNVGQFGAFLLPSTTTTEQVVPFNTGGTTSVSAKSKNVDKAMDFAKAWSLSTANLKTLIESDGAYPNLKNIKFSDFGATVTPLYTSTYALVTADNDKVNAFAQVNNDDAFPAGVPDDYNTLVQKLFTSDDVTGLLSDFEQKWDAAQK